MKKMLALLLAILMVLSMAACSAKEEPAKSTTEETSTEKPSAETPKEEQPAAESGEKRYLKVALGLNDTLSGLKPTVTAGNGYVIQWIFATLMRYDVETGEYVPCMAEKVDISGDGLTYTAHLRKDANFHDGTPVTADDVIFTFNQVIIGGGMRSTKLSAIEGYDAAVAGEADTVSGIQKVDDKTVVFTLSQPNSLFMEALSNGCFSILPAHYFEGCDLQGIKDNAEFWSHPVGSGAYYVSETAYPNYIVLSAYDGYFETPGIENILCTYYADQEATYAAMIAGEIDVLSGLEEEPANNIVSQNSDIEPVVIDSTYHRLWWLNTSGVAGNGSAHPSLQNARVRQALSMIMDRDSICQLYGDLAVPANSHININMDEYNKALPEIKRDVEAAKQILEEEGFDFNTPLRLYANYADQITADFMELTVQMLAEAGVQATYVIDANWQEYLATTDYDFRYAANMTNNVVDFYNTFEGAAPGSTGNAGSNFDVENPEKEAERQARYVDLVRAWKSTLDAGERQKILDQLQLNAYEDMYCINLYSLNIVNLYNTAHVTGYPIFARDYEEIVDFHYSDWQFVG